MTTLITAALATRNEENYGKMHRGMSMRALSNRFPHVPIATKPVFAVQITNSSNIAAYSYSLHALFERYQVEFDHEIAYCNVF